VNQRVALLFAMVLLAGALAGALAQKKPPAKPIDLNTATVEQLQQLPGIGPVTAQAILDFREKSGPFRRVKDLLAIRGISETRFKAIAPYVKVLPSKPAASPKLAPASG
jgi:competence protein ComEA